MFKFTVTLLFVILLSGCSSSSDHMRKANQHAQAGDYHQSTGQSHAAQKEYKASDKHKKKAADPESIIFEILEIFFSGD